MGESWDCLLWLNGQFLICSIIRYVEESTLPFWGPSVSKLLVNRLVLSTLEDTEHVITAHIICYSEGAAIGNFPVNGSDYFPTILYLWKQAGRLGLIQFDGLYHWVIGSDSVSCCYSDSWNEVCFVFLSFGHLSQLIFWFFSFSSLQRKGNHVFAGICVVCLIWKSIEETLLKKRMKRKGRCFHFMLNVVSHGRSCCSIGTVLAQYTWIPGFSFHTK